MSVLNTGLATPSRGSFTIDQSLKFNDDDSAYLSWTPASAGTRTTWTFSAWVKRANFGEQDIFGAGTASSGFLKFRSDDVLQFGDYTGGYVFDLRSNAKYRDASAWYHIIAVFDTTNATAALRQRLYVNGSEVSYGTQTNTTTVNDINNNVSQWLGHLSVSGGVQYLDGYLAEVHFIDGTALTPASFGETGDYGEWNPIEVSGLTYGTNGFYLSFAGGGIVAATGGTITTDGDYKVHTFTSNGTFTPTTVPTGGGYAEYLIVAGGGGGGVGYLYNIISGGGGAGGYLTGYIPISAQGYSITVGAGGAGGNPDVSLSANGSNSTGFGLTAVGGGAGRKYNSQGEDGGSGGGTGLRSSGTDMTGGDGTSGQGYDGGSGTEFGGTGTANSGGGGGGASAAGGNGSGGTGGAGGNGKASSISGGSVTYAGGGGGGGRSSGGAGGSGGGGAGHGGDGAGANATGYGSGGGGGTASTGSQYTGGNGSAGIVIVRYKFQ